MALAWLAGTLAAEQMDRIDWVIFAVAVVAIPVSAFSIIRWWRRAKRSELPRDWPTFWMIAVGLVCMVCIVCWYLFKFIRHGKF